MTIDATFWVAVSFLIFIGVIFYFKVPQKVKSALVLSIKSIKNQIDDAEKLKEEAKNILSENEKKIANSKDEIKLMVNTVNDLAEKNILKSNTDFHDLMENRKKNTEIRIRQIKSQAIKDIKNAAVKISIKSVEKLLKNSLDKSKLDKLYTANIEETKLALKRKSS